MDYRRLVAYVVYPFASVGVLIALYFSGSPIIVPQVDVRQPRELGLLENLQAAYLAAFVVVASVGLRRRRHVAFAVVAAVGLFVLLEELDYGVHLYEFLTGERAEFRSLHNRGLGRAIRFAGDVTLGVFFVLVPLLARRIRRPLRPHLYSVATVVGMFCLSRLTHALGRRVEHTGLEKHLSEFRELNVYWLWLVYLCELVFTRRPPPPSSSGDDASR